MPAFLLAALVIALIAVLFALQNVAPVTVSFLAWTFSGSLAVVVVLAAITGAVVALLALVPVLVRSRVQRGRLRRQVSALEARLRDLPGVRSSPEPPGPPLDR